MNPSSAGSPRLRLVVGQSWKRCLALGLARDSMAPPPRMDSQTSRAYRETHVLTSVLPLCTELLGDVVREEKCVFAVTDAHGRLLHLSGDSATRHALAQAGFLDGADWSEAAAGTNAIGTALVDATPVRITGAEHFNWLLRGIGDSACPIHQTGTSTVIGTLAVMGSPAAGTPLMLALVRSSAKAIEYSLAADHSQPTQIVRNRVRLTTSSPQAPLAHLIVLGRDRAVLQVDGHVHQLTPRRSEIVLLLSMTPAGLTADELAEQLSADGLSPTTIRVEMSRLRQQLGDDLLDARPYALRRPIRSDIDVVTNLITARRTLEAFDAYPGPPLPHSLAPAIIARGRELHAMLRQAIVTSYNAHLLRRFVDSPMGRTDADAWTALAGLIPVGSPQREQAAARAAELRRAEAAATR